MADDPSAGAVESIAQFFRQSGGNLRVVAGALIDMHEAWSDETRKFRTPQEWLIAVLRAFNAEVSEATLPALRQLRHPLWSPLSPKGFGDSVKEWADPDSLLNRAELARTLARRLGRQLDPRTLLDVVDVAEKDPLREMLSDKPIAAADRVALAIAGPAFQWR